LTAVRLAQAITCALTDPGIRARARALGERIRAEDGIGKAVEIIEGCTPLAGSTRALEEMAR